MKFPITKIDLLFWGNMKSLGLKPNLIKANTKLLDFTKIFNDSSLFHYFSGDIDIIQIIYQKYKESEKNDDEFTGSIDLIPLMILNFHKNDKTALELASEH